MGRLLVGDSGRLPEAARRASGSGDTPQPGGRCPAVNEPLGLTSGLSAAAPPPPGSLVGLPTGAGRRDCLNGSCQWPCSAACSHASRSAATCASRGWSWLMASSSQ